MISAKGTVPLVARKLLPMPLRQFALCVHGLVQNLSAIDWERDFEYSFDDNERRQVCKATPLQSAVASVHFYTLLTVIDRAARPVSEFVAPKHGTLWQPFIK